MAGPALKGEDRVGCVSVVVSRQVGDESSVRSKGLLRAQEKTTVLGWAGRRIQ